MPGVLLAENVGKRPYEMVNAGRTTDAHPPLVDFENLNGWTVETVNAEASFTLSREQQLWGDYVAQLTYKNVPTEEKTPMVTLKPSQPIPIGKTFDCVNLWLYGNRVPPQVSVTVILQGGANRPLRVPFGAVNWSEWFLLHKKLSAEQLVSLGNDPCFVALEISGGTNTEPRKLFFDNLSFFKEELPPLSFEPRPLRNIKLPEGQTTGTNTGPGTLPFPNREETILPTGNFYNRAGYWHKQNDGSYSLSAGGKGEYEQDWIYRPQTGTLDDLTLNVTLVPTNSVPASGLFSTKILNSGIRFVVEPKDLPKLLSIEGEGSDTLTVRWQFDENEVEYRFSRKQKSLIVDVRCLGGNAKEFSSGGWSGLPNTKLVKVPYLTGNGTLRPAIVVAGTESNPLFILSTLDHTRSNASELFWENKTENDFVSAAACSRYNPKTDGKRNDLFERLFITVSPIFEEVLPNIPNDPSPWRHVTAERVWKAHGSSNHDSDYAHWSRVKRYGMEKMLVTDHETLWRDGEESFTFRTYAAPGKGGDDGQKEYTRKMHELGFLYGPYNNYTDYAPVNEFWNPDWVTRLSDGNYRAAWRRCYNPKPAIAVQTEPKIAEIVQQKFGFNTAYCDVHTAVQPWRYVDDDARVPGAGTFAATFYAYGEILLHQRKNWGGPVYSEGNNHWYYSGLTDGNYAQDQAYFVNENGLPWIVDFDLLKIHPLENNFGMGYLAMFYGTERQYKDNKERMSALDRFLAATLAFGHTGFFASELGLDSGARSYFVVQPIAARYGTSTVKTIRYADETGKWWATSQAVASDAVRLNRINVEYVEEPIWLPNGIRVYVNGNDSVPWSCYDRGKHIADIPPHGWYIVDPKEKLTAWSLDRGDRRTDYVDSPAYLFANVRDNPKGKPQRFDRLLCDRQLIVRKNIDDAGRWEMIAGEPNYAGRSTLHAVRLDNNVDADVVALDFDGKEIGKAETRYSRGMVHVLPVEGAFSYVLTPKQAEKDAWTERRGPHSRQTQVVPGDRVDIQWDDVIKHTTIPHDARPETLFWLDGLDFEIVSPYEVSASYFADKLEFSIRSNYHRKQQARVELLFDGKNKITETVAMHKPFDLTLNLDPRTEPKVLPVELHITATPAMSLEERVFEKKYRLVSELGFPTLEKFPDKFETGYCFRNGKETAMDDKSGASAYVQSVASGGTTQRGWSIHPPYRGGVGYTFLLSGLVVVPEIPNLVLSIDVGLRTGGDASDGVLYKIVVVEDETFTSVAEVLWDKKSWGTLQADLTKWAGKTVRVKLIADVGPNNNSTADWACIANIRWEMTKPMLLTWLEE